MAPTTKKAKARRSGKIPERYQVKKTDERTIVRCTEAPNISIRIERGSVSEAQARKSREGSIFVDGAAHGPPFMDHEKRIYNLDHHEGVVRAFTLATCEQALVLVLKGLDLKEKNWTIHANDPDLDTLLAIWVLCNHVHITNTSDTELLERLIPLIRVEGLIDSHGLELLRLAGFTEKKMRSARAALEQLRAEELRIKKQGSWDTLDFADYAAKALQQIDQTVYHPSRFADYREFEELARVPITDDREAVVLRSEMGIYELEEYLEKVVGSKPGIIALEKGPGRYTLRQCDPFLPTGLGPCYDWLNQLDPAVRTARDAWGGSAEIGGSPRISESQLDSNGVARAIELAFRKRSPGKRVMDALRLAGEAALVFFAALAVLIWPPAEMTGDQRLWIAGIFSVLFPAALLATRMLRTHRFAVLQLPVGRDWWLLFPIAFLLGSAGTWPAQPPAESAALRIVALLLYPVGMELIFRGHLYERARAIFRVQLPGGRWFLSNPALLSTALYASATLFFGRAINGVVLPVEPNGLTGGLFIAASAGVFGLISAAVRERSGSLLAPILLHLLLAFGIHLAPQL